MNDDFPTGFRYVLGDPRYVQDATSHRERLLDTVGDP